MFARGVQVPAACTPPIPDMRRSSVSARRRNKRAGEGGGFTWWVAGFAGELAASEGVRDPEGRVLGRIRFATDAPLRDERFGFLATAAESESAANSVPPAAVRNAY
jgi:hypothetical protein